MKFFVCRGGVAALGGLKDIESELRLGVGSRIVGIRYQLSEFPAQLRVEQRNGPVHGQRVAIIIGGIVRQRSQSESVLIEVLGFADQVEDKIAAPDVMRQIAEELAAERIIPQILNDAPSVGESVRFGQLVRGGRRESFE